MTFPKGPGIYKFHYKDQIVYIGKSKNLRQRIQSYLYGYDKRSKIKAMLFNCDNLTFISTRTHLEARILEYKLIKSFKPIYNSQYKREKPLYYLKINNDNIININDKGDYGPFIGDSFLKNFLKDFSYLYPLYFDKKEFTVNKNSLNFNMSKYDKDRTRDSLRYLFSDEKYIDQLKNKLLILMKKASRELKYEKASLYLSLINNLEYIKLNLFTKRDFLNKHYIYKENDYLMFIKHGELSEIQQTEDLETFASFCNNQIDTSYSQNNYSFQLKSIVFNECYSNRENLYDL